MAPPFTFTRSGSTPISACQASTTEANASLHSKRSMPSMLRPARFSAVCVAGIGPVRISTGSLPVTAMVWTLASGVRP